ncbi:MAG: KOW motif-containing protein, partial [Aphanizomenon sp.]
MAKRPQPKVFHKMHVKTGDTVQVIAGKDKGKVGEVIKALPQLSKVLVKGVNIKT